MSNKYVIKFSKEGYLRFISHLDLLRLFKRSFKRVDIKLQYSNGFNPHPKMSFAQPLSLGHSSISEYLEFETVESHTEEDIVNKLNSIMPEGLEIKSCYKLPEGIKTLAALTYSASYEVKIPFVAINEDTANIKTPTDDEIKRILQKYFEQSEIKILKHQRKSGKDIEIDLKPLIAEIDGSIDNNYIMLTFRIAAGSTENLSPDILISSIMDYLQVPYDKQLVEIKRTEIYFNNLVF